MDRQRDEETKDLTSIQEEKEQEENLDRDIVKSFRDASETIFEKKVKLTTLKEVYAVFNKWIHLPYPPALKIILATCLALELDNPPPWLYVIGPSGSGKTVILRSLRGANNVILNAITPKAFVSGLKGKQKDYSTLPIFHMKNIIIPELSTMLTKDPRVLNEVFGELTSVHDELFGGGFGSGKPLETYTSKVGLIIGVTSVIDKFYKIQQVLGPRTMNLRLPDPDDDILNDYLLKARLKEGQKREELRLAAVGFLRNYEPHPEKITISKEWDAKITALAKLASTGRSYVPRDGYTQKITEEPEKETLSRLKQNFILLALTFCQMEDKTTIDEQEYTLIKKIAWDCLPPARAKILKLFVQRPEYPITDYRVEMETGVPQTTAERALSDLVALKICEKTDFTGSECQLSPKFTDLAQKAELNRFNEEI